MTSYNITKLWIILTVGLIVYFYFSSSLFLEYSVNVSLNVSENFFNVVGQALEQALNFKTPIGILNIALITFYSLLTATVVREWLRV